ncbi:MAG: ester cyclase [Chthoniobacterales bacterium]
MDNSTDSERAAAERLAREHLNLTARGDLAAVAANVTSDYYNQRYADEPLATRQRGPEGLKATIKWLHRAFTEMRFEFHEILVEGDRAVARVTPHARQHGPFVVHDSPDGRVTDAFPSNGRSFAVRQTHWFKIAQGAIAEHDAVRDDLGMAKQLGWIPPRPLFIVRMLLTLRRERRRLPA